MTILQKIFIILIILFLVFGAFALLGNPELTFAAPRESGASRYSTSVAWLEMCAVFLTYQVFGLLAA